MNLISCSNCGVVLDKNALNFPFDISEEDGYGIDDSKAGWDGYDFVPKVGCPVCTRDILETQK